MSGLIDSPLDENPTLFGRGPSSYNSALGFTAQWFPRQNGNTYLNSGIFDGNGAKPGYQTGLSAPWINNYLFQIAEFGVRWAEQVWKLAREDWALKCSSSAFCDLNLSIIPSIPPPQVVVKVLRFGDAKHTLHSNAGSVSPNAPMAAQTECQSVRRPDQGHPSLPANDSSTTG